MNITNELLANFGIVSMVLTQNSTDIICHLIKVDKNQFLFKYSGNFDFTEKEKYLSITTKENNSFTISSIKILILESGIDYFICTIVESDEIVNKLLKRISVLEYQDEKYGRRKEPRVSIGKSKAEAFGLSTLEQKIFSRHDKIIQPCVISDVSLHGICIISPFDDYRFKNIDNFIIQVSFKNPEQIILLQAHKVHLKLNHFDNKTFATISCQLLEPISYIWKERVVKMLDDIDLNN